MEKISFNENMSPEEQQGVLQHLLQQKLDSQHEQESIVNMQKILSAIFNKYGMIELSYEELNKANSFFILTSIPKEKSLILQKIDNPYTVKEGENNGI